MRNSGGPECHFRSPQIHVMSPWVQRVFIHVLPRLLVMRRYNTPSQRTDYDSRQDIFFWHLWPGHWNHARAGIRALISVSRARDVSVASYLQAFSTTVHHFCIALHREWCVRLSLVASLPAVYCHTNKISWFPARAFDIDGRTLVRIVYFNQKLQQNCTIICYIKLHYKLHQNYTIIFRYRLNTLKRIYIF